MKESSIEEDIKHLEKRIDLNRQMYLEFGRLLSLDEKTVNAIENLINKNKEQEKIIELMAKELAVCGGFDYVEFGMSTGDFNKDIKNMIDYFKKKASEKE